MMMNFKVKLYEWNVATWMSKKKMNNSDGERMLQTDRQIIRYLRNNAPTTVSNSCGDVSPNGVGRAAAVLRWPVVVFYSWTESIDVFGHSCCITTTNHIITICISMYMDYWTRWIIFEKKLIET